MMGTILYCNDTTTLFSSIASHRSLRETDKRVPASYPRPRSRNSVCVDTAAIKYYCYYSSWARTARRRDRWLLLYLQVWYYYRVIGGRTKTRNLQNDESEKNAVWLLPTRCWVCRLTHAYNTLVNTNKYKRWWPKRAYETNDRRRRMDIKRKNNNNQ